MATLPLTLYQLQIQVAQIRQRDPEAQVIGIRATGGWQGPEIVAVDDCCYAIVQANTVLEVREALQAAEERQEPMILLTRLEQTDLGYDVVARLARSRLFHLDVWESVRALFKSQGDRSHPPGAVYRPGPVGVCASRRLPACASQCARRWHYLAGPIP